MSDALIKLGKTVAASLERSWLIINNWQFKISNKLKYQCFVYSDQEDEDYNYDSPEASTQSAAYELQWNEADDDSEGLFIFSDLFGINIKFYDSAVHVLASSPDNMLITTEMVLPTSHFPFGEGGSCY